MIETYKKGNDISVMVWGCFGGSGRTDLYILDHDFESKKHVTNSVNRGSGIVHKKAASLACTIGSSK
jgi:hypothetical protein